MDNNLELKEINKKIFIANLLGYPGWIMLGIGLYSIYGTNGDAFHPALNNPTVGYSLIVIGAIIGAIEMFKLIPLWKKRKILNENNT